MVFTIEPHKYKWAHPLIDRPYKPPGIVIHNAAAAHCTADDIHRWHLANGWSGIAYHAFVTKEGRIIRGRPPGKIGGHTLGAGDWLGICFEGDYDREEKMPAKQLAAGQWLVRRWRSKFGVPLSKVMRHKDMPRNSTSCPGQHFPFAALLK
jgi:N-acetylmuramoyl-L-alanine amidase CwlA